MSFNTMAKKIVFKKFSDLKLLLPFLMVKITQHPRHRVVAGVDFEWSSQSWTHNIFRVWELLFWRRLGKSGKPNDTIKPYNSFEIDPSRGYFKVHFHCKEAAIAHFEGAIRQALHIKQWKNAWEKRDVLAMARHPLVVQFGMAGFLLTLDSSKIGHMIPLMSGAIAFDGAAAGPSSFSLTTSGSNRILFCASVSTGTVPQILYNSVGMTEVVAQVGMNGTGYSNRTQYLVAPATGSNTVDLQSGGARGAGASYTGVSQGALDNTGSSGSVASSPITSSVTTVADLCWVFMGAATATSNTHSQSASTGSTQRAVDNAHDDTTCGAYDNGSAKTPAGAVSMSVTWNNPSPTRGGAGVQASFAPLPTTYTLSVNDTISIAESIVMLITSFINVNDAITITESVTVTNTNLPLSVFDTITITEQSIADSTITWLINVNDSISITESVTMGGTSFISVNDAISITESVTVYRADLASGIANMRGTDENYLLGMDDLTIL